MVEKICVIVGVGEGVGMAVARRFGQEGFKLALIARRPESITQYAERLAQAGIPAHGYAADSGAESSLVSTFNRINSDLGAPTVLVYNAAAVKEGQPSELTAAELLADFQVNVTGALISSQQVIPGMREQGAGTILFTGGGLALNPRPKYASLAIGKAGLRSLAFALAGELAPDGIHVATVTIAGFIQPGTHFDPTNIAASYWALHTQPKDQWETEVVYK
jgi:short-subunit dehydrogenase